MSIKHISNVNSAASAPQLNPAITAVAPPPIADVHGWIAGQKFSVERPLLDVAQAVPVDPPPVALRRRVTELLISDGLHRYTPITGLPELREALAEHMAVGYAGDVVASDTVITAGCNQAFCSVVQALAGPGDEVLIPVPYYFNHQMWMDMIGVKAIHISCADTDGAVPSIDAFAAEITPRTRAIAVVSPNNPTGAVYPPALLESLFKLAQEHKIALILDETYKDFHPDMSAPAHNLFAHPNWRDTLVQLFSFSKSYALTGFRVGSVIAGPGVVEQVTKIQDCLAICAPRVSQVMALHALAMLQPWVKSEALSMRARVVALEQAFADADCAYSLVAAGAWFAYVRHPFGATSATTVARRLAHEHAVLCIPGEVFGPGQSDFVRFAFANLSAAQMPQLLERLLESQST